MFSRLLAVLLLVACCGGQVFAQGATEPVVVASAETPSWGDSGFTADRLDSLILQCCDDETIPQAKRDRIKRIMEGNRPFQRLQKKILTERVRTKLAEDGYIDVDPDGQTYAAVPWAELLKVLQTILPLLIQLFG